MNDSYSGTHPSDISYLKFWGTRGSINVAGNSYAIYGGNTVCLEIHQECECAIIDAGSGIRELGECIVSQQGKELYSNEIHLIIGHYHLDHILGFPFFPPLYQPNFTIHIYGPGLSPLFVKEQFLLLMSQAFFPISIDDLPATLVFHPLTSSSVISLKNLTLHCCHAFHPGDTLCFKIHTPSKIIGYATDNEFFKGSLVPVNDAASQLFLFNQYNAQLAFFQGCDLMIHEAQYFDDSYPERIGWGHSSLTNATALMAFLRPKEWIITHHDPQDTDALLQTKLQRIRSLLAMAKIPTHITIAADNLQLML